jgi:hypothetical protein
MGGESSFVGACRHKSGRALREVDLPFVFGGGGLREGGEGLGDGVSDEGGAGIVGVGEGWVDGADGRGDALATGVGRESSENAGRLAGGPWSEDGVDGALDQRGVGGVDGDAIGDGGIAAPIIVGADVGADDDGAAAATDKGVGLEGVTAEVDATGAHRAGARDGGGALRAAGAAPGVGGVDDGVNAVRRGVGGVGGAVHEDREREGEGMVGVGAGVDDSWEGGRVGGGEGVDRG